MAYKGQKGTFNGSEVEVTLVHEDGALDLQKVWSGTGSAENLPWYERVAADQFTSSEPEAPQADAEQPAELLNATDDSATIEELTGGVSNTDIATDEFAQNSETALADVPVSEG